MSTPKANRNPTIALTLFLAVALVLTGAKAATPPKTPVNPVTDTLHDTTLVDPYRWLEDRDDPEVEVWLKNQNNYTDSYLDTISARTSLRNRLEDLLKVENVSVPKVAGARHFYKKRAEDEAMSSIYLRNSVTGEDTLLIDPLMLSNDSSLSVGIVAVSRYGDRLIYSVRKDGVDESRLRIFDVEENSTLPDSLPEKRYYGGAVFDHEAEVIYYGTFEDEKPVVYKHVIGQPAASDEVIFDQGHGPETVIGVQISDDYRYLILTVWQGSAGQRSEIWIKDIRTDSDFVPVVDDIEARFEARAVDRYCFIQTNWNAPNGRIMRAHMDSLEADHWLEIVPETNGVLEDFALADSTILVRYLENVHSRVLRFAPDGTALGHIALPAVGRVSAIHGRFDLDEAFYSFSSFVHPTTIYRYLPSEDLPSVWHELNLDIDTDDMTVRQIWYESKDGTRVPMFVVHREDITLDGRNPVLMTGYGGFNLSITPSFSSSAALWVENGGVYVKPNLRGGGEFGEDWHQAGMLANKQNTFDDFIAAAEWLIENDYTNPDRIAIWGGSNGGLLVGAAMSQRPDLFEAVICSYPLLDMVRYHQFLVARFWVPEYGSAEDPEQFEYILEYSPYHNVEEGRAYPATLFVTGDNDTRVDPLHARKMAAMVQARNGGDEPILLRYHSREGHSGGRPIDRTIDHYVDYFSFLFWQLGIKATPDKAD